jgi:hypothetical protein
LCSSFLPLHCSANDDWRVGTREKSWEASREGGGGERERERERKRERGREKERVSKRKKAR